MNHIMPSPTKAIQGSEAKILVLQQRYERGEQLFHPDDPHGRVPLEARGHGGPLATEPKVANRRKTLAAMNDDQSFVDEEINDDFWNL